MQELIQQTDRRCTFFYECQKEEVYNGHKWKEHWRKFNDKYVCSKHYCRLVSNPKRVYEDRREKQIEYNKTHNPINNPIYGPKRITYKNQRITFDYYPRTGFCNWCTNNINDESCKITSKHHIEYFPIFKWFGTIEICNSCHAIETQRLKKLGVRP